MGDAPPEHASYSPGMRIVRLRLAGSLLVVAFLMCLPVRAHADAGIPMMPVQYPLNLLYLVPVIAIEAICLNQTLNARWRRTILAVSGVNLITMALGYPLAWLIYSSLNSAFQFPDGMTDVFGHIGSLPLWLSARIFTSWSGVQQSVWPVLVTFIVLLVPGFLLSGIVKASLIDWYDLVNYRGQARAAVWLANRLSYFFLVVAGCVVLYLNYTSR
jgi:hypothetical protein